MARRLPASLLRPAGAGGAPRAADDLETREKNVEESMPQISEETGTPGRPPRSVRGRGRTRTGSGRNRKSGKKRGTERR